MAHDENCSLLDGAASDDGEEEISSRVPNGSSLTAASTAHCHSLLLLKHEVCF